MSQAQDPNSAESWRRSCRRWQRTALMLAVVLVLVTANAIAWLVHESSEKRVAWERVQAHEARQRQQVELTLRELEKAQREADRLMEDLEKRLPRLEEERRRLLDELEPAPK